MYKRKPETLALFVALIGTLTVVFVFLADLLVARNRDIDDGDKRLQHFGIMMAEHTARSFEAVDVLLREMAADLASKKQRWEKWTPAQGWEYIAQRHSRAMPQLRDLIIFDGDGEQRFVSTYFPTPRINVSDRPYYIALKNGAEEATFGPYVGRTSGRYGYALARRINHEDGSMAGVGLAVIEPSYLQDFCWPNRLADDSEAVLINAKGQIVASCRPTDLSRQSPILGAIATDVLFAGQLRDLVPESGLASGNHMRISVARVPGFADLRILTAIPESTLLTNWKSRLIELSTLALLVTTVLLTGGLMVRRQVRDMAALTAELAAGHENLEARIKEATLELAGQKDTAERANRAKSRFLAAASHDLRQPLHAMSLFAADLQRQVRSGSNAALPRLADQISTSTAMLGELLDSLLDISRLDVVGIKPDVRLFPLGPIFDRLSSSWRRAAIDHKIMLRFRPTVLWVESDPVMVERIIGNLVSNALRYTPAGGRVMIAARRRGDEVLIQVRDSGMGIAPEHQAAIFAEFYQVGNEAREHNKGLGLGLSIVDRLARALNISVNLSSRLGAGTNFSVLVRGGRPIIDLVPAAQPEPAGKILCIGTSEALAECSALVKNWDYAVSTQPTGSLNALPRSTVIIADIEFAEIIGKELSADTPLIILTSGDRATLPPTAHALPLPIRPAKLRALVGQLQKTLSNSMP